MLPCPESIQTRSLPPSNIPPVTHSPR
jgi:hypothetical protein